MRIWFLIFVVFSLASCGFTPRQANLVPQELRQLAIVTQPSTQAFAEALKRLGSLNDLVWRNESDIRLNLIDEKVTRRLLSVFASGQVAEYELNYTLRYQLSVDSASIPLEINILRDYQDDPKQVLAKSLELELIMQELRTQAAEQLLRTLAVNYQTALLLE
jgi:LPS-assembly lipoprotein